MREPLHLPDQWSKIAPPSPGRVETLHLRDGVILMLNEIAPGEECEFHGIEAEDVFGIGFHLRGGSRFDMEGTRFDTRPLEVHAGAAPRTSTSSFILPEHGFRTVSIRFSPDAAQDMLARHDQVSGALAAMAGNASEQIAAKRLAPLDPAGVALVEAMFATHYTGAARALFLESCALGLLAAQIDAATPATSVILDRRLIEARSYLDAHLDTPPSIFELARFCGMNDFALKRAFKVAFGATIFGYVRQRRMERAAGDLHAGLSVALAAQQAGYECPRCFSAAFRRHFGQLPSEVTRSALKNTPAYPY